MYTKAYPCDLCKKTFSRNGDLTRHKAIHSGEKNHVCGLCGMRFAQHSGLKTHRNTHTGEKPHRCDYCGKAFGDPSSCARHEKEKHFGKPFRCRWCPSSIVRRSSFAGHIRQKHPEIGYLVTKEFLDELEGPRMLKPRNRRGRARRSATMSDPRALVKDIENELYGRGQTRRAVAADDEIMAPIFAPVANLDLGAGVQKVEVVDSKADLVRTRRDSEALSLAFGAQNFGGSYVEHASMSQQRVPQYTQSPSVYQHQMLESLNFNYGLPVYGGPPQYDVIDTDVRSVSSSPGPVTPTDMNAPPAYVEPSKINPYDYSLYGTEGYVAPPLYSFVSEQQGLLYLGL